MDKESQIALAAHHGAKEREGGGHPFFPLSSPPVQTLTLCCHATRISLFPRKNKPFEKDSAFNVDIFVLHGKCEKRPEYVFFVKWAKIVKCLSNESHRTDIFVVLPSLNLFLFVAYWSRAHNTTQIQ